MFFETLSEIVNICCICQWIGRTRPQIPEVFQPHRKQRSLCCSVSANRLFCALFHISFYFFGELYVNELVLVFLEIVRGHLEVVYNLHSCPLTVSSNSCPETGRRSLKHLICGIVDLDKFLFFLLLLSRLSLDSLAILHELIVSHHEACFLLHNNA